MYPVEIKLGGPRDAMIEFEDELNDWLRKKSLPNHYRLRSPITISFEFKGRQWGHPSNYAAIRVVANPAHELRVNLSAALPSSITQDYRDKLEQAIAFAAIDELIAGDWCPYRGATLTVDSIGWDDVMSSELAVYRAARGAFSKLRAEGKWEFATSVAGLDR
jgi:hypothetical protein